MTYHIGLGIKNKKTMVIEARKSIDCLSCEIYDYMGQREITKQELNKNRYSILAAMKTKQPAVYGNLHFAIVD